MTIFQYPETKNNMREINSQNSNEEDEMDWNNKNCFTNEILKIKARNGVIDIKQSPININSQNVEECHLLCNLEIHYKSSKCHIEKTPQGIIRLHWDTGSYITYNKKNYELKYIYFHTPSMHLIDNNSSQMEINLYHVISEEYLPNEKPHNIREDFQGENKEEYQEEKIEIKNIKKNSIEKEKHAHDNKNNSKIDKNLDKGIILSILVNHNDDGTLDLQKKSLSLGTKENIFIGQFANNEKFLNLNRKNDKYYNYKTTDIKVHKNWNIKDLIPKKKSFYKYEGSLPFPPCTQGYTWIVFDNHTSIIEKFINNIRKVGNPKGNRETHPLNERRIYYNNNIVIEDEEEDEIETKNKMVKKILAPIRIQVEDRDGDIYRKEANEIVYSYTYGDNKGYYDDEEIAKNISTRWNDVSKLGFVDEAVSNLTSDNENVNLDHFYKNVIWDYYKYSNTDYLVYFINYYKDVKKINLGDVLSLNRKELINAMNKLTSTEAMFYDSTFDSDKKLNITYVNFNIQLLTTTDDTIKNVTPSIKDDELTAFQTVFSNIPTENEKKILYLILDWHDEYIDEDGGKIKLFDTINVTSFKEDCMSNLIQHFRNYSDENKENIIFRSRTTDLTTTVEGHSCQRWGSNQVHHEGSIFNLFSAKVNVPQEGYTWEEISNSKDEPTLKKMIRDGTLSYEETEQKWKSHNKCRNPGNSATAPWCYTTDSDERWAYCLKPNIKIHTKKYILIFVFLMIVFLSYYMVTLIFKHELFTEFVASLTGAKAETNNVGSKGIN